MKPPPRSELSSSAPARAGARVCWPTAGAFAAATIASTSASLRRTSYQAIGEIDADAFTQRRHRADGRLRFIASGLVESAPM